jgi:hypothetical protein
MRSQNILHSETIPLDKTKEKSIKLGVGRTYGEIRVFVSGTYTLGTGTLHSDFPKNIFRNITLKRNNGDAIYAGKSKDIRLINFYDSLGVEHFTAAGGKFEALFKLNKSMLLADKSVLPDGHTHPFKEISELDLSVTWAGDSDVFSNQGTGTFDGATAYVSYDQVETTKEEVAAIFGENLEKYALAKVGTKQTQTLATSSELGEVLDIGNSNLIKRALLVTLDGSDVEQDDLIEKYQVKQTMPAESAKELVTSRYDVGRADDKTYYNLTSLPTGVVAIDYDAEVAQDGRGILVPTQSDSLKLLAKVTNAARLRYIEEAYVVDRVYVGAGGDIVLGV